MARDDTVEESWAPRIVLRPLGNPLPLGFLGLAVATVGFSALQLDWIPATESRPVALSALLLTAPVQLLASIYGFLARDPVAGTGMGVLAGTWATVGYATLTAEPGSRSEGLGVVLLSTGAVMAVPAFAASNKLVPAAVMGLSGARFTLTGLYEVTGSATVKFTAGISGLVLAVVALYAAAALEIEGVRGRTVMPLLRRGSGRRALDGGLADQLEGVTSEPGVRRQL